MLRGPEVVPFEEFPRRFMLWRAMEDSKEAPIRKISKESTHFPVDERQFDVLDGTAN
jgi:hypothetical protein